MDELENLFPESSHAFRIKRWPNFEPERNRHLMEEIEQHILLYPDQIRPFQNVDDAIIAEAEEFLGVHFPRSYRRYLQSWGNLEIGSTEIYGLFGPDFVNSSVPDVAWFHKKIREVQSIPNHLVIIQNHDDDCYDCLDSSAMNADGECPVVRWDAVNDRVEWVVAEDFVGFLRRRIQEELEDA